MPVKGRGGPLLGGVPVRVREAFRGKAFRRKGRGGSFQSSLTHPYPSKGGDFGP